MSTVEAEREIQTLIVRKEIFIDAPLDIVWETLLEPQGRFAEMGLKLEAWPGGRWFRDLGNNTGHLWGHVQVIKPPKLLEITGPMMMSYPVASHVQYRLTESGSGATLSLVHQAIGLISDEHLQGVNQGWGQIVELIKTGAEAKRSKK